MILEYQTKSTLNPNIWHNGRMKPKLRSGFLKIAEKFTEFLDTDATVYDIILIGSNANYNWTSNSDIDIHVVVNYQEIGQNLLLVKNYMMAKKSLWTNRFPLSYKGMDIELFAQDVNQELHTSVGEYSLMHDKWIRKPKADIVSIDDSIIDQKMKPIEYEIDNLDVESKDAENKIKNILKRLYKMRQTGLEAEGEYSIENLAFKRLRSKGKLSKLKEILKNFHMTSMVINESKDAEVVNMIKNHIHSDKKMTSTDWKFLMKHTNTIVSDKGQWEHPGQCTLIRSGDITMKDVDYPVFGFDETGHSELMKPEKEYNYPGKMVFEMPFNNKKVYNIVQKVMKNEI